MKLVVYGRPIAQGSKRHIGHGVMIESSKHLKPWRQQISETALALQCEPLQGAVVVYANFFFKRPRSAKKAQTMPTVRPDLDKCSRAILDGLTGILYHDDAQVIELRARKDYGEPERAEITVEEI